VAQPPTGKDPDELVRLQGAEGVQRVLTAARPLLEYLIESALAVSVGQHDARAQADKVREVAELIAAESDPTARLLAERYADSVAARLGVGDAKGLSALRDRVVRGAGSLSESATPAPATPNRERASKPLGPVESQVLGALVEYPDLQHDPTVKPLLGDLEGELALALVSLRAMEGTSSAEGRQSPEAGSRLELDQVSRRFPDTSRALVAQRLVAPQIATREAALVVLLDNLSKLQRLQAKRQLRDVVEQVRKAEAGGDMEAIAQLLADQQARARARRGLG
jgi:DNA primase